MAKSTEAKKKPKAAAGVENTPAAEPVMAAEIIHLPLELLVPYTMNSRTHSEAQVQQIAESIKQFGFTNPILLWKENNVIAGHGRVMAARRLNMTHVPCIRLEHLTDEQRRAYVIADNKLALNAGWDNTVLAEELKNLDETLQGLTGFSPEELDKLLATPPEEEPEQTAQPITMVGDVWILGNHRVRVGMEVSETDYMITRWEAHTGKDAIREEDGMKFKQAAVNAGAIKWAGTKKAGGKPVNSKG